MKRATFFQGMFALLGFGQQTSGGSCLGPDGYGHPCKEVLKEGEELCPIGHAQKPKFFLLIKSIGQQEGKAVTLDDIEDETVRSCSICGIVYVKENSHADPK